MKDVMIDIETLGTRHDAMIIQIGACYFDRETGEIGDTFSKTVSTEGFYQDKFSVDYETVKWWFAQSKEAQMSVMKNPTPIGMVLEDLDDFIEKDTCLWSHATFDIPILGNAFATARMLPPVKYRNMRDIRTLMDLAGPGVEKPRTGIHHNALDDCKYQVEYCVDAMKRIKNGNQNKEI